jgi:hypothetical protein
MKDEPRAALIARLEALGGRAIALHYPGIRELRSALPVPGMSLALLDEIVAALAEDEKPAQKRPEADDDETTAIVMAERQ